MVIKIAVRLSHVLQLFLRMFLSMHPALCDTGLHIESSSFWWSVWMLFVNPFAHSCVVSLFIFFQVSQKMNDVCYTVCLPLEPSGKVVAKEPHEVLLLCSDIHLGNSNRAFTVVKKCGSSSIYSCWIFLGLLRLFIVNTVVCVVPRAHPPAATIETICIPYQISAVRRCKQCVSRGRPPLVFPSK